LIELLVVISVISLLSSVVFASLNSARSKARDAKRISQLKEIQSAIEFYFDANNGTAYPTCSSYDVCTSTGGSYAGMFSQLDIQPTYISSVPVDPINTIGAYGYYYARGYRPTGKFTFESTGFATDYILATRLENSTGGTFSGWDNANLNFLLGNL